MSKIKRKRVKAVEEEVEFCNSCGMVSDDLHHVVVDAKVENRERMHAEVRVENGRVVDGMIVGKSVRGIAKSVMERTYYRDWRDGFIDIAPHDVGLRAVTAGDKRFDPYVDPDDLLANGEVSSDVVDWSEVKSARLTSLTTPKYSCEREAHLCDSCIELIFDTERPM